MHVKFKLNSIFLYAIVFFIPYTAFRIAGLKISEILSILLIVITVFSRKLRINKKSSMIIFLIAFSLCIAISAILSYVDPINQYKYGYDEGIFYSFEIGWIMKIVRLIIVCLFAVMLQEYLLNQNAIQKILHTYVVSNVIIDLYILFSEIRIGEFRIGIDRTAAMAVEPSEAGFINCMAIISAIYLWFRYKSQNKKLYIFELIILVLGQLVIGSTASMVAVGFALLISICSFISKNTSNFGKRIFRYAIFFLVILLAILFLENNTNVFEKIINYQKYLNIKRSSVAERLVAIQSSLAMFFERPIMGIGFGNYGWYIRHFVTSSLYVYVPGGSFQPNNLYAELLAELGIVGFSIYIVFILSIFKKIVSILKDKDFNLWMGNLTLAFILYLIVHNLSLTTLYSFQFWITVAICEAAQKSLKERKESNALY